MLVVCYYYYLYLEYNPIAYILYIVWVLAKQTLLIAFKYYLFEEINNANRLYVLSKCTNLYWNLPTLSTLVIYWFRRYSTKISKILDIDKRFEILGNDKIIETTEIKDWSQIIESKDNAKILRFENTFELFEIIESSELLNLAYLFDS